MTTLEVEAAEGVARVWLNRPRRLNAIDAAMAAELRRTFDVLDEDASVRAVLLAGRGRAFCAGFDLGWLAGSDAEGVARELPALHAVYDAVESCGRPVAAAVHGAVVGGGLLLTLVADLCLAAGNARFSAPEVKLGFLPPLDFAPRLERAVGLRAAKRLILTGEPIDAAEALRLGLVHRVVDPDRLQAEAGELALQLASLPARAIRDAKQSFRAAREPDYRTWEAERLAACWQTPERERAMEKHRRRP